MTLQCINCKKQCSNPYHIDSNPKHSTLLCLDCSRLFYQSYPYWNWDNDLNNHYLNKDALEWGDHYRPQVLRYLKLEVCHQCGGVH